MNLLGQFIKNAKTQKSDYRSQLKQNSTQQKKQSMTQTNISDMLCSLHALLDAESGSSCDAFTDYDSDLGGSGNGYDNNNNMERPGLSKDTTV